MNTSIAVARTALRHGAGLTARRLMGVANSHSIINSSRMAMPSSAMMMRHFSVAGDVSALLQRELDEEMETGSTEMPQDLKKLQKKISENWTIIDDSISGTVKLVSKGTASPKVSIVFHCQDTLEAEYDEGAEAEGEEDHEPAMAVRFSVLATKAGKTLLFSCLSEHAEASVETVAITSDVERAQTSGKVETELYQGPEFTELDVELQEGLNDYVAIDCGVDTDVAAFIAMYADYKEQNEYVKWIKDVQKVIA